MRAVVTGASGFIGSALVSKLINCGNEVFAISRSFPHDYPRSDKLHCICLSFTEYDKISDYVDCAIDWFAHFAWQGVSGKDSANALLQVENIRAAVVALEQAERLKAKKFVFAGSSYQYRMEKHMIENNTVYVRKNLYGCAKQACADLLLANAFQYHVEYNTVLFTNVYGVGDRSGRSTNTMILRLLKEKKLDLISGEHQHDWTYIDDAIGGILSVLERGHSRKSYYIGSRELVSFQTIILRLRNAICPEAELVFGSYPDDSFIDYSQIDLNALYFDTGYECHSQFEECVRKTAEWLMIEQSKVQS